MLVGTIITAGELSTKSTILPSSIAAAAVSGRSVYLNFGKGFIYGPSSTDSARLSIFIVSASTFMEEILSLILLTSFISATPSKYAIEMSVLDFKPARVISTQSRGSRILLLISATLETIVSTKPSLEPLRTLSFQGSSTLLIGYVLQSIAMHSL